MAAPKPKHLPRDGRVWVASKALNALAANGAEKAGFRFTTEDLMCWLPGTSQESCRSATTTLMDRGYIRGFKKRVNGFGLYALTATGLAAVRAAAEGKQLTPGMRARNCPPPPDSLVARLWQLLRARRVLDGESAAATLIDAGSGVDMERAARSCASYLRQWARCGNVQTSRIKGPSGRKQFVLVQDQPHPPHWSQDRSAPNRITT
jgi:hypothetical protein